MRSGYKWGGWWQCERLNCSKGRVDINGEDGGSVRGSIVARAEWM